jgi:hypothetical protein
MPDRFVVVETARIPWGYGGWARRAGDKGGLFVIYDSLYGGPPSNAHASTVLRAVAELHCRALNAYNVPRYCGGDHCSQLWNLPCDDPVHRRPDPPPRPGACYHPIGAIYFNPAVGFFQCHRCGAVADPSRVEAMRAAMSQEKGT